MSRVILQGPDVGQQMEYMLATGNLRSKTGLGFQQVIFNYTELEPYIHSQPLFQPFQCCMFKYGNAGNGSGNK